jgi:hypothetical protein
LLEVMVVVVILAIMSTMAMPYLTGTTRRTFELCVDQVADLLTMYAQRDNLGQKPVGLWYDAHRRQLELVVLDVDESGFGEDATWRPDRFIKPVKLPDVVDGESLALWADGELLDITDPTRPIYHTPGDNRPTLEIALQTYDQRHYAALILTPHAVAPRRLDDRALSVRMPEDLDAAGRSREDW